MLVLYNHFVVILNCRGYTINIENQKNGLETIYFRTLYLHILIKNGKIYSTIDLFQEVNKPKITVECFGKTFLTNMQL